MSLPENDNELEAMLTETFGPPPTPDLGAWRQRHPQALGWLNPQRIGAIAIKRKRMQRILMLTATAAAAICMWLGLSYFDTNGAGASAFAQTVEQIQKARTITWKHDVYLHVTDGKSIRRDIFAGECAYKAPGLYREVRCDKDGQVTEVEIKDWPHGRKLTYFPDKKMATVEEIGCGYASWQLDEYRYRLNQSSLQWIGKRNTATGEANVFRDAFRDHDNERNWSIDFWIDVKTKQLVAVCEPGADIYDPDNDPARSVAPENYDVVQELMGARNHDIRYDVALDDSLFSTEPPEGYAVEVKQRPRITEKEMIDYLGILAEFNGEKFPDTPYSGDAETVRRVNLANSKSKRDFTTAERKYFEAQRHYSCLGSDSPFSYFTGTCIYVVPGSLRYLGKGVKLGDKDGIVCWYKLKDAKDPNIYRVVYGDLSVRDVDAKDLPLPVDP